MSSTFWFIAGIIIGATAALVLVALWRAPTDAGRPPAWRYALPLVAAVVFVGAAAILYRLWGAPAASDSSGAQAAAIVMDASHADAVAEYRRNVARDPGDAASWAQLANLYRQQRDYVPAQEAFARLVALNAMTADSWADYADVQASVAGSLAGEPEVAIDKALALDPAHAKALWLKASLAHRQGNEAQALSLWTRLRAVLPADSSDARLVDDNIAEARRLASMPAAAAAAAPAMGNASAATIVGTVSLEPRFVARVKPGTTLFIFARAIGTAGPPVAVLRTTTGAWPLRFRLDDTMAMMPTRKLSDSGSVTVEARISTSGQADPQSGDLYAVSEPVSPGDNRPLALAISRERT
jgi:cytochrome c-type biogenesis protein CcmH